MGLSASLKQAIYFVYTPDHQFVLKLYSATTETAQIYYEHSLLTFLISQIGEICRKIQSKY
jgi:Ser/Thr protein kinase RdoA (MazF antagonist)